MDAMKEARKRDKGKKCIWKRTNVKMIMNCNECGTLYCIYSKNTVGSCVLPVGPTDEQLCPGPTSRPPHPGPTY
eukprot:6053888-Ditylum_brightwellii.AAC.2